MKTLISDHDYELHLGGTAKPGRFAAGFVGSVPDPGGPFRLDQWGTLDLDGRGPRPSSQGDRGKEIRKRFWTQSYDRGPREITDSFPIAAQMAKGPDIVIWAHDKVGEWADAGLIAPALSS